MSERRERAQERTLAVRKIRTRLGWLALLLLAEGVFGVVMGLLLFAFWASGRLSGTSIWGVPVPEVVVSAGMILTGIAVLHCARGLWDARPWARRAVAALCALSLAPQITALEGPQGLVGPALSLALIAYLLLPSTARLFARAQGSRADTLPVRPAGEASS